ncbi:unnamed protein product [Calicophoron daubneyi]|uniref:CRIB domain-containing protein n=1 Tax=Calicophoron daubneyi TaxID=300641 RepID=A0AAV2TDE5_CALDB
MRGNFNMVYLLCCIQESPPQRKVKLDHLSIGNPTGFRHITHLGSSAVEECVDIPPSGLLGEQHQPVHLRLVDLPVARNSSEPNKVTDEAYLTSLLQTIGRPPFLIFSNLDNRWHEPAPLLRAEERFQEHMAPSNRLTSGSAVRESVARRGSVNVPTDNHVDSSPDTKTPDTTEKSPTLSVTPKTPPHRPRNAKSTSFDFELPLPPPPPPPPRVRPGSQAVVYSQN